VAVKVIMPQAGQDLETGVVKHWHKAVGDTVAKGEPIVQIETEKVNAIASLRREAVDLAIAGASKVIEKNLDDASNRALVERYLSSLESK